MIKYLLFLIISSLIILWGCSTTNKLSQDELFQKKQECIKYERDIQKDIEKVNLWWKNESGVWQHSESLSEIFYSPAKNSCLYSVRVEESKKSSYLIPAWNCTFYKIYDFLHKWDGIVYLESEIEIGCNYEKTLEKYNQALKQFKSE